MIYELSANKYFYKTKISASLNPFSGQVYPISKTENTGELLLAERVR